MGRILDDLEPYEAQVYFDDIVIGNKSKEDHFNALKLVLDRLK